MKSLPSIDPINKLSIAGVQNQRSNQQLEFTADIDFAIPPVLGNPIRLRQMLDHLLANAVCYSPDGGRVHVSAFTEDEQVIIQVADTGIGIPTTDQAHVFDRFYRAKNIPTDAPGTGLGLAIVKSIVDNHQGRIWLISKVGEGTTFSVVLPVAEQGE